MKTLYIGQLPAETQKAIREELKKNGLNKEDIERGMDGRLCDLEDTIDIEKYLS
jgi:hypothetical protein